MSKNMPPMRGNDFDQGLRLGIQAALGNSGFDAESRDRYEVFGWPEDPDEEDYVALYLRNGYAKTVVDKPAFTTWRDTPKVKDRQETDSDTQFEREVKALARQKRIWAYCERGDRVSGVLNHGLLLLGFQDVVGDESGDSWEQPLWESDNDSLDDLNNLKPIVQTQIDDIEWGDVGSERWEKPEYYHLDLSDDIDEQSEGEGSIYRVHWSRVIDIPATRPFDDDTIARSRLEPVLNNLIDIEKTRGSAAEQSYRGADYGLHINYDPTKVDPDAVEDSNVGEEFQNWYHGLQPQFTTVGGEVNQLGGEMQDPGPIIEENVNEMAAQTGIPKREFRGNQQGEQAGAEQDEKSYFGMISERREQYANPHIIRKFIDRLLRAEILTQPTGDGYLIEWPDLTELSEAEEASLESDRANVVKQLFGAGIVLDREDAIQIVKDGEYPSFEQTANITFDESDPRVQEQFQKQLGNANRLPSYIKGRDHITRELLTRWVMDTANGMRANDWNPALHPRDPETGEFVERTFPASGVSRDMVSNTKAPDLLVRLGNAGENVNEVLSDDSVTIDGIPDSIDNTAQLEEYVTNGTLPGDGSGDFSEFEGEKISVNPWTASLAQGALNGKVYVDGEVERYDAVREKFSDLQSAGDWGGESATLKLTELERNRAVEALREDLDTVNDLIESGTEETLMIRDTRQEQRRLQTAIAELS